MSLSLSSRIALVATSAAAALAVGVAAPGAAFAAGRTTSCNGYRIVDRPGQHPVMGGPAHKGQISLGMSTPIDTTLAPGQWWQFSLDEYNGTGAAYQHVAVEPGIMGWTGVGGNKLDGMTPKNTRFQAQIGGVWTDVPLASGCDPEMTIDSTLLDHPLAAGAHWSVPVRIEVDPSVVAQLKSFTVTDRLFADGALQKLDNPITLNLTHPKAAQPSASASASASPSAAASATTSAAASGTPAPTASGQSVAAAPVAHAAANGSNGTYLGIGAALLVAAGLVGLVGFRKRRGSRA